MRLLLLPMLPMLALATQCPSKHDALECFYKTADSDGDAHVTRKELIVAIDQHLPWWKRAAFHLFGGVDAIFKDCDANGDGLLTIHDANDRPDSCMETCYKRQATVDTFKCY